MAIRDLLKISRKTFINPRGWIDYDSLRDQNRTIWGILRTTFTPDRPEREETFEQAKKRLNLSDEDIETTEKNYQFYAIIFAILGILCFIYSFYLVIEHFTFTGLLLGLAATALFLSQAFKYDFWCMQLKNRKLGLTIKQWRENRFGKQGKSS